MEQLCGIRDFINTGWSMKMNRHYLIDYENVREHGLQGLSDLSESDTVHIFYSQNANTVNLETFSTLMQGGIRASLKPYLVGSGKQSADMQLVSFLGYLIGTEGLKSRYFIISRDSDFQNTPAFWKSRFRDITVVTAVSIQQANEKDCGADVRQAQAPEKPEPAEASKRVAPVHAKQTKKAENQNPETAAATEKKGTGKQCISARRKSSEARARLNSRIQKTLSEKKVDGAKISDVASTAVKYCQAENCKEAVQGLLIERYGKDEGKKLYRLIAPLL